nr:NAD(P)/FAD-dependent oxidoreductase [Rivibacter subsaxonicus]
MQRRQMILGAGLGGLTGAGLLTTLTGCATGSAVPASAKVVVIGGGYGGATAAKYVRLLSDHKIDVVLVEPEAAFISCPLSNLVLAGTGKLGDLTVSYEALQRRHGVKLVRDRASRIDPAAKTVTLAGGASIRYDKLVLSPGIELMFDRVEGLAAAQQSGQVLQAWKAGPETEALFRQLQAMRDGGTYAITIPEAPYRCPPGPYERACMVAAYFKREKPKSKVLILDANPDVTSKGPLFKKAWAELYPGMVEYRPQHKTVAVDAKGGAIKFEVQEDVKADVLNVLPPMRAGRIAVDTGLANSNARWVGVNYQSFEATAAKDIFVVGDSIQIAPLMPKSGHMANSHAKVAAAAIVAQLSGWEINPRPMLTNTCYSFVGDELVIHVASVHAFDAAEKTFKTVAGSGGVSAERSAVEALYAKGWARNIWADSLG